MASAVPPPPASSPTSVASLVWSETPDHTMSPPHLPVRLRGDSGFTISPAPALDPVLIRMTAYGNAGVMGMLRYDAEPPTRLPKAELALRRLMVRNISSRSELSSDVEDDERSVGSGTMSLDYNQWLRSKSPEQPSGPLLQRNLVVDDSEHSGASRGTEESEQSFDPLPSAASISIPPVLEYVLENRIELDEDAETEHVEYAEPSQSDNVGKGKQRRLENDDSDSGGSTTPRASHGSPEFDSTGGSITPRAESSQRSQQLGHLLQRSQPTLSCTISTSDIPALLSLPKRGKDGRITLGRRGFLSAAENFDPSSNLLPPILEETQWPAATPPRPCRPQGSIEQLIQRFYVAEAQYSPVLRSSSTTGSNRKDENDDPSQPSSSRPPPESPDMRGEEGGPSKSGGGEDSSPWGAFGWRTGNNA